LFLIRGTANNGPGCRNIKKLGTDIFFRLQLGLVFAPRVPLGKTRVLVGPKTARKEFFRR